MSNMLPKNLSLSSYTLEHKYSFMNKLSVKLTDQQGVSQTRDLKTDRPDEDMQTNKENEVDTRISLPNKPLALSQPIKGPPERRK